MVQRYEQKRRLQWYKRGAAYECCCDHDCSYEDYHDSIYCDRDEYEGIENDDCYDDNCGW